MTEQTDWRIAWAFNVIDEYKSLTVDEIKAELKKKALPFAVCMQQIQGDFNFGTVVRNANAFGASEVFYFGKRKWDKRGAQGTYKYTDVTYLDSLEQLKELSNTYTLIAVDNLPGSVKVHEFVWPEKPLLLFGEEGTGLTQEILGLCSAMVAIEQHGSVRSLNVGCASSIVMYDYVTKFKR